MRIHGRALAIVVAIALSALACASPAGAVPTAGEIDALLQDLDHPGHPGCAVGVMRDGALTYSSAHGLFDIAAQKRLEADSIFNIGSISKQFTAFAVLLLAEQGKLSLDASVRRYVPELGPYADAVTIRHLLHHVGALRDYIGLLLLDGHRYSEVTTEQQALQVLSRQQGANGAAGVEYEYSNTGYFLLGLIVERTSGTSLARFSKQHIFDPLGMRDTRIVDHYPVQIARLAKGYLRDGDRYVEDHSNWEQVGDGQVHSTVADLARWADNYSTGKVGGKKLIAQMAEPYRVLSGRIIPYGTGLALGTYRGLRALRHGGDWAGFHGYLLLFPEQRFAVGTLCNLLQSSPARYSHAIADRYLQGQLGAPDLPKEVLSLRQVDKRTEMQQMPSGIYRNPARASYVRLSHDGGGLTLKSRTESYLLREYESRLYQAGPAGDDLYVVSQLGDDQHRARIIAQDSPEPVSYDAVKEWNPDTKRYAGEYTSTESNARFVLVSAAGKLSLSWQGGQCALEPMSANEFAGSGVPDEGQAFTLQFSADGTQLSYFTDGLRGVRFKRSYP